MTTEEIISTLNHSSLPTILVEGDMDAQIIRKIEGFFDSFNADIIICHGIGTLNAIYKRKSEITMTKVAFFCDQDMNIFSSSLTKNKDIFFTYGYCIENDLLLQWNIEQLLDTDERAQFDSNIIELSQWFAFEIENYLSGNDYEVRHHVDRVINTTNNTLKQNFLIQRNFKPPLQSTIANVSSNYKKLFRGKQIFQLFISIRNQNKNNPSKYSHANLTEIGIKSGRCSLLKRHASKMRNFLENA